MLGLANYFEAQSNVNFKKLRNACNLPIGVGTGRSDAWTLV